MLKNSLYKVKSGFRLRQSDSRSEALRITTGVGCAGVEVAGRKRYSLICLMQTSTVRWIVSVLA